MSHYIKREPFQALFTTFLAAAEEHLPGGAGDAPGRRMGHLFTQLTHSLVNNLNELRGAVRDGRNLLPVNLANALYAIPSQVGRLGSATLLYSRRAGGHLYTGTHHALSQAATFANYSYVRAEPFLNDLSQFAGGQMRGARQWIAHHPLEVAAVASAVLIQQMIDDE